MKRPAFQFYPADWQKDPGLQSCSLGARGLWVEMMCIAHQSEPYGHLAVNGNPMTPMQLSRLVGANTAEVRRLVDELEKAGVFSMADNGAMYSRRMVTDERLRNVRAEAGKLGGNPSLLGGKVKQKVDRKVNQKPTPSSSSSSSNQNQGAFAPPDWVPLDPWKAWLEVRRKKRAPNTDEALRLSVLDLDRFRAAGHDPRAVLEQSVKRGWQGLFEIKTDALALAASPQPAPPSIVQLGSCPCGAQATMKVGGRPRCASHVKGYEAAA